MAASLTPEHRAAISAGMTAYHRARHFDRPNAGSSVEIRDTPSRIAPSLASTPSPGATPAE